MRSRRDARQAGGKAPKHGAVARAWKEIGRYGSVGVELVLTILIVAGLGHWLDSLYGGGRGWGTAIGFLLGAAVAFRNLMRTAREMQRDIERAEARDPEGSRWTVDPSWVHKEPEEDAGVARPPDPDHTGANEENGKNGRSS
jgi:F0F1-type ATP synthase assembly protein I